MSTRHADPTALARYLWAISHEHSIPYSRMVWECARTQVLKCLLGFPALKQRLVLTGSYLLHGWIAPGYRPMHSLKFLLQQDWSFNTALSCQQEIAPLMKEALRAFSAPEVAFYPDSMAFETHFVYNNDHFTYTLPCRVADTDTAVAITFISSRQNRIGTQPHVLFAPALALEDSPAEIKLPAISRPLFMIHAFCSLVRMTIEELSLPIFLDLVMLIQRQTTPVSPALINEVGNSRIEWFSAATYEAWMEPKASVARVLQARYQYYVRQIHLAKDDLPDFPAARMVLRDWAAPLIASWTKKSTGPNRH
jgi:hypothetical protein